MRSHVSESRYSHQPQFKMQQGRTLARETKSFDRTVKPNLQQQQLLKNQPGLLGFLRRTLQTRNKPAYTSHQVDSANT